MKIEIPIEDREKAVVQALTSRPADRTKLLEIIEGDILIVGGEPVVDQDIFGRLVYLRSKLRQSLGMPAL